MKMVHRAAQRTMPLRASEPRKGRLRDHAAECISCQAEASRYRTLQRVLATFAHERVEPPFDLVPGVMAGLGGPMDEAARRVKASTAAAVAAVAAGAVVIAKLARRRAA